MSLQMVFFLFTLYDAFCQNQLVYESFTINQGFVQGDWNIINQQSTELTTICENTNILGGYQKLGSQSIITKFFQLPPHSLIKITMNFWKIDNWNTNDDFKIFIDGQSIHNTYGSSSSGCIEIIHQYETLTIDQTIQHNFNTALIIIYASTTKYWGISNFKLYIQKCPDGCLFCSIGHEKTSQCITWLIPYQSLIYGNQNDFKIDGWQVTNGKGLTSQCLNVPLLCGQGGILNYCYTDTTVQMSTKLPKHNKLKFHFRFFKFDNWITHDTTKLFLDGTQIWQANYIDQQFTNICGKSFNDFNDNIEIELNHQNQNFQVLFQGSLLAPVSTEQDKSYAIRDIQIFINNICDETYDYQCCGDSIKQRGEDCDDGNNNPFDGCHNCRYSCVQGCSTCIQGECYECLEGWMFENICQPQQLQEVQEIVRNITQIPQIFLEGCEIIFQGQCYKCLEGWIHTLNICLQNTFNITNYQCDEKCSFCYQGICQQCNYGYSLSNNECLSICGDNLVNKDEKDGKFIEECDTTDEGCINCQIDPYYSCIREDLSICWENDKNCLMFQTYSSIKYCIQCTDGYFLKGFQCAICNELCITCENDSYNCIIKNNTFQQPCEDTQGLYSDEFLNTCHSICGDGILVNIYEQCDDGNINNNDGCSSNCQIENNWVCQQECTFSMNPELQVNYISQAFEYQYIEILFNQKVKRNSNTFGQYKDNINITLLVDEDVPYNATIFSVQPAQYNLEYVNYQIEIAIYSNLNHEPYLQIELLEQLYNSDNLPLKETITTIKLNQPMFLTQSQIQSAQNLGSVNKATMYSLSSVGVLLLLTGSSACFWGALEVLQEQSYLKYINVNYPENYLIYFDSFEIVSLTPLLEYLHLDTFFFPTKANFHIINTEDKFLYYEINASLAYNIKSVFISFFCTFIIYVITLQFQKLLSNLNVTNMNFFIAKFLQSVQFRTMKINQQIRLYGVRQLMLANFWDITFMVLLQLRFGQLHDWEGLLLTSTAAFLLIVCLIFIVLNVRGKQNGRKAKGSEKYRELILDVCLITKKILYMSVLVFFQKYPVLQVNSLSLINTIYLICIISLRNQKNRLENIKNILSDSCLILVIISSQLYLNQIFELSYQWQTNLSWINIAMLSFVTFIHMVFDTYEVGKKVSSRLFEIICSKPMQMVHSQSQKIVPLQKSLQRESFPQKKSVQLSDPPQKRVPRQSAPQEKIVYRQMMPKMTPTQKIERKMF